MTTIGMRTMVGMMMKMRRRNLPGSCCHKRDMIFSAIESPQWREAQAEKDDERSTEYRFCAVDPRMRRR